jgi:hypothetical protein
MTSLDILTPRQAAPAVVATSTAPAAFVRDSQEIIKRTFGVPPLYEGYYIEVRDSAGEAFFIQATDFRLGAGHQWIRADEQTKLRDHRAGSSTNPSTPIPTG